LGARCGEQAALHQTGQADRERLRRKVQRALPGGVPQRELVRELGRSENEDRNLEEALQRRAATQLAVRIDAFGVLKPLPRTGRIGGRNWGAGHWNPPGLQTFYAATTYDLAHNEAAATAK